MIFQEANYFSIGLLAMGVIGSMSCSFLLFLSKDTSSLENDNKDSDKNNEQKDAKNDTNLPKKTKEIEQTIRPKLIEDKIFCQYCRCKFNKNKDKCPYCGAPVNK